jgi:TRAP-type uncharacterized transport system substrate-binding protein
MKAKPAILPILLFALTGATQAAEPVATAPSETKPAATDSDQTAIAPITMSTGAEGGGYWGLGSRMAKAITKYDGRIEVKPSAGSLDNLQRLDDPTDPTALGLTQADALSVYLDKKPMFASRFTEVESIGKECVFIITAADSGIESLQDLEQGRHRIAINSETSGSAVTFKAMQAMQPALAASQAVYIDPAQAMTELGKPIGDRSVDALMMVHRPKLRSEPLKHAIFDPTHYRLVTITDKKLDGKLPSGKTIYTPITLPLLRKDGTATVSVETICMDGLLLSAHDKLDDDQKAVLKHLINYDWMRVYAEPEQ